MKYSYHKAAVIVIFAILFFQVHSVYTENFKPFRFLRTIKTEHFDIIFPKESEVTAHTLAGFADEVYEEINILLGINLHKRIPVVITPDTDQFNGYMNSVPYPHIVLFDTPMDLEWTSYENSLRSLFFHELTHAFSLSSRSPFFETVYRIFGGWVMPTSLNTPQFMTEGVTVSFESLGGFGRANDPLIKEEVRQAIYENKTMTPLQLSRIYDLPPTQAAYYEYGGLFSAYLQQIYGMEKYASFWQAMGRGFRFSFNVYNSGMYRLFKDVYGISFMEAWTDFLNSLALDKITENPRDIPFKSKRPFINVLASSGEEVYFGNHLDRELLRYNPKTEKIEKVMAMDSVVYDMGVSPDGKTLLLSSYRYKESLATAVVTEYNASNGWKTGREWESLYRGQYFREGVIGISSDRHNNNIVYRSFSGEEEILLHGNEELMYTTPHAINDAWIIYVRAASGVRELAMFNYETKKEYTLKSDLEDDTQRWKYIRNLRVSNGKVMFVYNHDDRMYKLGIIDISQFRNEDSVMNAVFNSADFSGGVFFPVHVDGTIYYRGYFSTQDKLMRFPETIRMLSGAETGVRLVPEDKNIPPDLPSEKNDGTNDNIPAGKPYFGLKYMNPLSLWFPLPLIRTTESFISLDGLGVMSIMMDPAENNIIFLSVLGDWEAKMADINIQWYNYFLGLPLNISFEDGVNTVTGSDSYRKTQASISSTFTRGMGNERNYFSISNGLAFSMYADNPFDDTSAYAWSYDEPVFSGVLGVALSSLYRYDWQLFGTGANINLYGRTPFTFFQPRADATAGIALEKIFPLRFQFYGAWDESGMDLQGNSRYYNSYFQNLASIEYPSPDGLETEWIAGAEAEVKLFAFELQRNLSHIYFNRIFGTLAYRGVMYDGQGIPDAEGTPVYQDLLLAQSLILRLGFEFSMVPIKAAPLKLTPNIWGAWKISNMNDGKANDFYFNYGFELNW